MNRFNQANQGLVSFRNCRTAKHILSWLVLDGLCYCLSMSLEAKKPEAMNFKVGSILRARCPSCHKGKVLKGVFSIRTRCPNCNYNFEPEPGFYLGAMAVGFLLTAVVTIPPTIILKILNVDIGLLIVFPIIEFIFVGTFLMFYSRILWLHLEYQMTKKLDGQATHEGKKKPSDDLT